MPERMCVACRQKFEKRQLKRIVWSTDNNTLIVDGTGKANGRGAYLCDNTACWERATRTDILDRALRRSLDDRVKLGLVQHGT